MHNNYYLLSPNYQLKRKHCPYKPGSVSPERDACHLSTPQVTPRLKHSTLRRSTRLWADNPQPTVYANLQPPDGTALRSPAGWWSLTPPSHPYHMTVAVVFFSRLQLSPTAGTFTSGVSYAARTFLSCSAEHQRQTGTLLSGCEGTNKYSIKQ